MILSRTRDAGAFDWLTRLLSNRRAVFIATGARAQLVALRFRTRAVDPTAQPRASRESSLSNE